MKKTASVLSGLAIAAAIALPAFAANKPMKMKEVTLTGEVVDLTCYSMDGKKATGPGHKECATKCINEGGPVGLLLHDGMVYVLVAADHGDTKAQVANFIAAKVKVTGMKFVRGGVKVLQFSKIEAAG